MATPILQEPSPGGPPVPTVAPVAKPISVAELSREIQAKPPEIQADTPKAPPVLKDDAPLKSPANPGYKDALRKSVMKKEEEPAPEAKVAPKSDAKVPPSEVVKDEDIPEDQRRVLPHDKPDTAKRMKFFIKQADDAKKAAEQARQELDVAKKAPPTQANTEEVERLRAEYQKTQDDLLRYRRLHDIQNDTEFAAKYREPVKQVEATIESTLKAANFGESTLKAIRDAGGFAKFSRSSQMFTVQEPDPENEGKTRPVLRSAADISRNWLNVLPVADSEAIKAGIGKQQLLQTEEQAAIQRAQDEAKTYFENQSKGQREAAQQADVSARKIAQEFDDWVKKTESETDWMKDREAPSSATAEQKKEVEEYNQFNAQLRASLKKHPATPAEYGQMKLGAAEAHHLRRMNGQKDARIAQLEDEIKKARGAMRTTPKGGSLMAKPAGEPKKPENSNPTDYRAGLRARLQAAANSDE